MRWDNLDKQHFQGLNPVWSQLCIQLIDVEIWIIWSIPLLLVEAKNLLVCLENSVHFFNDYLSQTVQIFLVPPVSILILCCIKKKYSYYVQLQIWTFFFIKEKKKKKYIIYFGNLDSHKSNLFCNSSYLEEFVSPRYLTSIKSQQNYHNMRWILTLTR